MRVALGGASLREKLPNLNINRFGEGAGVAYLGFGTPEKEVYKVNKVYIRSATNLSHAGHKNWKARVSFFLHDFSDKTMETDRKPTIPMLSTRCARPGSPYSF